ncbi:MAG: hypothetical protein ACD_10C00166G0001 [uncultured bacterium]|nr:MAG: hypothetical protein ACD_10C00166G0001 [uncultured bacterium]
MMRSTTILGRFSGINTLICVPLRCAWMSAKARASSISSGSDTGRHLGSLFFTMSRMRRMILPARSA